MPSGILLVLLAVAWAAPATAGVGAARLGVQPLSLIAIHRARIDIDGVASVRASPRLLGAKVHARVLLKFLGCCNEVIFSPDMLGRQFRDAPCILHPNRFRKSLWIGGVVPSL